MAGAIITFLEWFFGVRTIEAGDLTVELREAGLGETSIPELQEALALFADQAPSEQQALVAEAMARLQSVAAELAASSNGGIAAVTATNVAATIAPPNPLAGIPGVTIKPIPATAAESTAGSGGQGSPGAGSPAAVPGGDDEPLDAG